MYSMLFQTYFLAFLAILITCTKQRACDKYFSVNLRNSSRLHRNNSCFDVKQISTNVPPTHTIVTVMRNVQTQKEISIVRVTTDTQEVEFHVKVNIASKIIIQS